MQKVLFRTLVGSIAAAIEAIRQYQTGAGTSDLAQAAVIVGVVTVAVVWGLGALLRKALTDG